MWNRKLARFSLALGALAFAGGCAESYSPTQPADGGADAPLFSRSAPISAPLTLDDEFARLAQEIPGFGGLYYDEAGQLNAVMSGEGSSVSAAEVGRALQTHLRDPSGSLAGAGILNIPSSELQSVVVQQGNYDFLTLLDYKASLRTVFGVGGVVFTDVDEMANRVRIGIASSGVGARVEQELHLAGVPREAVILEVTEPIDFMNHTLRDAVRPIAGGLQIWRFIPPGTASICTLGFNVRAPGTNVQGFVTNSHCTAVMGEVDGTEWMQKPLAFPLDPIAQEVHDASFFTCQYVGLRCRWSDSAGAQYYPGVPNDHGRIYRTLEPGTTEPATLVIDHNNEQFRITEEAPNAMVGSIANKVGRTTGWTIGPVSRSCIDTGITNTDIVMLCQTWVTAVVAGGDSGSPVFQRIGTGNNVRLVGLLWGGGGGSFVFSPMANIRAENPGPTPWITYPRQRLPS
jgi:hypothetical protein